MWCPTSFHQKRGGHFCNISNQLPHPIFFTNARNKRTDNYWSRNFWIIAKIRAKTVAQKYNGQTSTNSYDVTFPTNVVPDQLSPKMRRISGESWSGTTFFWERCPSSVVTVLLVEFQNLSLHCLQTIRSLQMMKLWIIAKIRAKTVAQKYNGKTSTNSCDVTRSSSRLIPAFCSSVARHSNVHYPCSDAFKRGKQRLKFIAEQLRDAVRAISPGMSASSAAKDFRNSTNNTATTDEGSLLPGQLSPKMRRAPVSYTHLTLPTSDLV